MLSKSMVFPNGTKVNFYGTETLMEAVEKSFPFIEEYQPEKITNEVTFAYKGKIKEEDIKIPKALNKIKGFAGPAYYCWKDGDMICSYSPKEERRGSHLVRHNNKLFKIYLHENEKEDLICRVARDVVMRDMLQQGYFPIHAGVVYDGNGANIIFGKKGSGKSTAMFSSILYGGYTPMSGDVAFVKPEKSGKWNVVGWPWRMSIDDKYFELIGKTPNPKYAERGKYRCLPRDFCDDFNCKWVWSAEVNRLVKADLKIDGKPALKDVSAEEMLQYLANEGLDDWNWGDSLGLGIKEPEYLYKKLADEVEGKRLTGDIIQYYKNNAATKTVLYAKNRKYGKE